MTNAPSDRLEILPVRLLDEERKQVRNLHRLSARLGLGFGWHYLLDLTWVLRHLGPVGHKTIMDAGAGTGLIQWQLARQGAMVYSIDRTVRASWPMRLRGVRAGVRVRGLRPEDLPRVGLGQRLIDAIPNPRPGRVLVYNQDLMHLSDLADESIDDIVSISSLEHNTPEGLEQVVAELLRVLKPGGRIIATLCTVGQTDTYHEASRGMCYSAGTLRRIFNLDSSVSDNYADYNAMMDDLVHCAELSDHLAAFYYQSGDNGMPWGKWDPQYQPVGIIKTKR